jgi:beta-glucanase (GH16 family)
MSTKHTSRILLSLGLLSVAVALTAQCPTLIWQDEFEGSSLDLAQWTHQTGDGCSLGENLCGWGNNELQWYQAANTVVEDGKLKIIAKKETVGGREYTSSRINTKGKFDRTYGRFEASIKLPTGQGLWPAFWMLPTDEVYGGWPQSGEIDIMELIGSEPEVAHGTIHFGPPWPNNRSTGEAFTLNEGTFNDGFHEFAIEWEAGEIRWYVDDYLYATKRPVDLAPDPWPFDQDFHFLLNVAVGGNWPGSPNAFTQFPQTMEVEYVRVYDGFFPTLSGARTVRNREEGARYSLSNAPDGSTFSWSVPEGATIVSGQGTNQIAVDWGDAGGDIQVEVNGPCETETLTVNVFVEPPLARIITFENFDDPPLVTFNFSDGDLDEEALNPDPSNEINTSERVGEYNRNIGSQFDVLVYDLRSSDLGSASLYTEGKRKFYLDVYTDAPVGTQILLQLENANSAQPDNYPTGRHSRFEAYTTQQNEWERLEFQFLDRPDNFVSNFGVNQFVFLFAPNSRTGDTYHIDNFDVYAPATAVNVTERISPDSELLELRPNPFDTFLTVENKTGKVLDGIQVFSLDGKMILHQTDRIPTGDQKELDLSQLPAGAYFLKAITEDRVGYVKKIVKE